MSETTDITKTLIIGGGIGGLFTGAFLARNGHKITVLEKNPVCGGGLQCFRRNGKIFETGMHILGGFNHGGSLDRICRYLGIREELDIAEVDADCIDSITVGTTGCTYRLASGREAFTASLISYFPGQEQEIKAYIEALYRLSREVPLFNMLPSEGTFTAHSEEFAMSADKFIEKYITDPELRLLLAYFNPLYGGIPGETPAYVNALISVLYINGSSRFRGGSQQLADALTRVIETHGGQVLTGVKAERIEVDENRLATAVIASNGQKYTADWFVSSVHPRQTASLVPKGAFSKAFVNRLDEIDLSVSAFTLFIDLKPDIVEYINHTCYYIDRIEDIWARSQADSPRWPVGMMYMTPPDPKQGRYASRLLVHCIMDWREVSQWSDTTHATRPAEYKEWKVSRTEAVLSRLEEAMPGIRDAINHLTAASPLTIRDYFLTPEGALFGYRKNCDKLMLSQIPVFTKVRNLLLAGQNINLHGICGTPLTSIITAEGILGRNTIINAINENFEKCPLPPATADPDNQ